MAVEFVNAGWLAAELDGVIEESVPRMIIRHLHTHSFPLNQIVILTASFLRRQPSA